MSDQVGRLPAYTERHFDAIDADFFSGDTFHDEDAIKRFEWYVARWQRQTVEIREMMKEWSESDGPDDHGS
jgi:hypothetical protein